MTFSDHDLKRLKEDIARFKETGAHPFSIQGPQLDALIARLEAAEAIVDRCECKPHRQSLGCEGYLTWRKRAGKS